MSNLQDRTKAKLLSLDALIAWSETKPARRTFNYGNVHGTCYFSQYLNENGYRNHMSWREGNLDNKWKNEGYSLWMILHRKFGNFAFAPFGKNTFGIVTRKLKEYRKMRYTDSLFP